MNAVEFVEKFGIQAVIERLAEAPESATVISGLTCMFFKQHSKNGWSQVYMTDAGEGSHTRFAPIIQPIEIADLKRLVESLDYITELGGLEAAKEHLCKLYSMPYMPQSIEILSEAIADVESVGGGV